MAAEIQFNVDAALAKLEALVATHGPQAVDMATHVVQISAVNTLTGVPGYGMLCVVVGYGSRLCFNRSQRKDEDGWRSEEQGLWILPGSALALGALVLLAAAVTTLFDVWAWVGLFNPKLALAHQVLARVAGVQ